MRTPEEYAAWQAGLEQMHRGYEERDQAEYVAWMDEMDAEALRPWAEDLLEEHPKGLSGAELEQRHVLDEAAHPQQVEALRRLAAAA
ncbi:hypothetical protein ACFV6F_28595 [Kitasatospora phosalacinea]|uniref:hypothetical protein n=1 Tax=Kitasatospora phosalacinea TaxID=2065 RepID=UPI0036622386